MKGLGRFFVKQRNFSQHPTLLFVAPRAIR
jgi:hypothetical protein